MGAAPDPCGVCAVASDRPRAVQTRLLQIGHQANTQAMAYSSRTPLDFAKPVVAQFQITARPSLQSWGRLAAPKSYPAPMRAGSDGVVPIDVLSVTSTRRSLLSRKRGLLLISGLPFSPAKSARSPSLVLSAFTNLPVCQSMASSAETTEAHASPSSPCSDRASIVSSKRLLPCCQRADISWYCTYRAGG
jgi:hypothetical protein